MNHQEKGSNKERLQYCLDFYGYILYMRIQGHSGGNKVHLSLQDTLEIPYKWTDYIYHVGSFHECNSIIGSGLIAEGKDSKEGRQTVFFTAVDPMNKPREDEPYDVTGPREVPCRTTWTVYQNAVFWINLNRAQDRRLAFWQTHSTAVILDNVYLE